MSDIYNYAVIGGGLTGLITSILLLKEFPDKNIVLFEKNKFIGGMAGAEKIGDHYYDSVYAFPNINFFLKYINVDFPLHKFNSTMFKYIGIEDSKLIEFDIFYDKEKLKKYFYNKFPDEKVKLRKFFNDTEKIYNQFIHNFRSTFNFFDFCKMFITSKDLIFNRNISYKNFLNKYNFKNNRLLDVFYTISSLSCLPPEKLNALIAIISFYSLNNGAYRQKNNFNDLIEGLKNKLNDSRLDINTGLKVEKIIKKNNIFNIITSEDGFFYSEKVISTIDTKKMLIDIMDKTSVPDYSNYFYNKIKRLEMTHSIYIFRILLKDLKGDYPLDIGEILYFKGKDVLSYLYNSANKIKFPLDENNFHFAIAFKDMQKKGYYSLELTMTPASYYYWLEIYNKGKECYIKEVKIWENFFLDKLEKYIDKNIKKKIIYRKSITPYEINKIFNLWQGSVFDMAYINSQAGNKRITIKTPIKNFYNCKFVHGIYGAFFQSFVLVDFLLKGKLNRFKLNYNELD